MKDAGSKLKTLANELRQALQDEESPDQEALGLLQNLEADLHQVIEQNLSTNEMSDLLAELQTRFAVSHPVAERYIRDIIDTLGKMGI
ncbi:protein of unknown function [Alteromonadaceae bacterium Bs31]|nr:protein of unknown function [Alteromonadaceae bacterium Bs31]